MNIVRVKIMKSENYEKWKLWKVKIMKSENWVSENKRWHVS